MNNTFIHVAVAVVVNSKGQVLVSQRKQGTHLGGYWEFPGGKLESNESVAAALSRELSEELDIVPLASRPLIRARYQYPEKSVLLDVWKIRSFSGSPRGVEGQPIAWRAPDELDQNEFPPADIPIIKALLLPSQYLITGDFGGPADFAQRLSAALYSGIKLVQLRLTYDWLQANTEADALDVIELCTSLCQQHDAKLMCNLPETLRPINNIGIHLNSKQLLESKSRPDIDLVSASCHNRRELEYAQYIGVDFAVLSPVHKTGSHPGRTPLGWQAFHEMVDDINIPVYALGGMTVDDLEQAWRSGAQGIAAIGAFWNEPAYQAKLDTV